MPGSFLASGGGSVLESAEALDVTGLFEGRRVALGSIESEAVTTVLMKPEEQSATIIKYYLKCE